MIYIGKVVNTHGIKGEIRIISDFKYKNTVFKENNYIYINDVKYKIVAYRHHKIYDMLIIDGINNIDDALKLKNSSVYIEKSDYKFDGILDEELIGLNVYDGNILKGKVINILKTNTNDILVVDGNKKHMVPNIPEFVKNIDIKNNRIDIEYIKGLDHED